MSFYAPMFLFTGLILLGILALLILPDVVAWSRRRKERRELRRYLDEEREPTPSEDRPASTREPTP